MQMRGNEAALEQMLQGSKATPFLVSLLSPRHTQSIQQAAASLLAALCTTEAGQQAMVCSCCSLSMLD